MLKANNVEQGENCLLQAMEADDALLVGRLSILGAEERHQVLYGWNETLTRYPSDKCIHELFVEQVAWAPEAVAVTYEGLSLSYEQLNSRANRLAHRLRQLGVGPDSRVAICVERSLDMVVGLLGILKAGAAYVPLDSTYPAERLALMLEDSAPGALLTQSGLRAGLPAVDVPVIELDAQEQASEIARQPDHNPDTAGLDSRHLAYVMYTSGSTGRPKGVMVEHQGVVRLVRNTNYVQLGPEDVVAQASNMSFDAATFEIWGALLNGARLLVVPPSVILDAATFAQTLIEGGVSTLWLTAGLFHAYVDTLEEAFGRLRYLLAGGDVLDPKAVGRVLSRRHRPAHLINGYGPTETTTFATTYEVLNVPEGASTIPIGRPISNTLVYILDAYGQPVPVGVAGEIHIGGAGVAHGYLNRPQLTAERFVADPFSAEVGARMYRTGDLGRWRADGNIEFLGRNDLQVKIRGFRIELGEIEAQLAQYPGVSAAVVVAREDEPGDKRLVAYYTSAEPREGDGAVVGAEALRVHLQASLPEYMVPAAYVHLEKLPLTPNGKLDRKALPAPAGDAYGSRAYEEPQGPTEQVLAGIWSQLLKVERVGRRDNFFDLGGHSLLAVRLISHLRQALGIEVSIAEPFAWPVLADLAARLGQAECAVLAPIERADRGGRLVLSFAQQRLWFLAQLKGASEAYHIPLRLQMRGKLEGAALQRALNRIVSRHEVLRTTFSVVDGEPVQQIAPAQDSRFALDSHDLRGHGEAAAQMRELVAKQIGAPFDLQAGPLIRGLLVQQADDEYTLLITMHHIVSDGWSLGVLIQELSSLYDAYVRGQDDLLAPLPVQYADYAVWQRLWIEGEVLRHQGEYWKVALVGAPALLELPLDHARPALQSYAGSFERIVLDKALATRLRALSKRHGTTLFMTLLATWATLLARLSGQQEIVIGTPVANRRRMEIEGLIGFFVNTLALRVDLRDAPTVAELLVRTKKMTLAAQRHQDIPFEHVVEIVKPVRSLTSNPLFQVAFAWQNVPETAPALPGLAVELPPEDGNLTSKFDLTLHLQEVGEVIVGGIEYATSLFDPATIARYQGYFQRLLQAMEADDALLVGRLSILGAEERHQVLYGWNETLTRYPSDKCIHELFVEQVAWAPEAVAVTYEGLSLSYEQLNSRANRLAHRLRQLGVGPDSRVAICVERSLDMVVGLLGILKAGAAYVPLDSTYPAERLALMLEDSAPGALLTQSGLRAGLPAVDVPVIELDAQEQASEIARQPDHNPDTAGLDSRHLAYVMYTSGSTGRPKGVMVEHQGVVRLVRNTNYVQLGPEDVVAQASNMSFDAATFEIWGALLNGARLLVVPPSVILDAATFAQTLIEGGVSTLWLTAGLFHAYVDTLEEAFGRLRYLLAGGDVLDPKAVGRVLSRRHRPAHLINGYGPTETTTFATTYEVLNVPEGASTIPIGRPISNTLVYILDAYGQPVPVGVAGEIHIGGAGVAHGYLNRPQLTAERFVADPFSAEVGARMYRTGDLGRWRADGNIEFLGRNDLQVKIRGFRIELGEIEAQLAQYPGVSAAVVVAREDEPGDKRLVAYYTSAEPREGDGAVVGAEALRVHLQASLPEYMVPAAYVHLEKLPLTPNGKLDRKALPAPAGDAYGSRAYEEPQGPTEQVLAGIWSQLLKVERVGRRDNFFDLGGHSLLAVRLISHLRQALGIEVSIAEPFAWPVLADLAARLGQAECAVLAPIERADRGGRLVLSFAQQRLWFLAQLKGASEAYHIPLRLQMRGKLEGAALQRALNRIVSRHEVLRTTFSVVDGEPVQQIAPAQDSRFALDSHDLRGHGEAAAQMRELVAKQIGAPFDLQAGPLIRGLLVQQADDEYTLLITMHHIVSDGWSLGVLIRELGVLYAAHCEGLAAHLTELPVQYADYAVWQRGWLQGDVLQRQLGYWKEVLGGAPPVLQLPTDKPRPAIATHQGGLVRFELDSDLYEGLHHFCQGARATLFMTLSAALGVLLYRYSRQEDICIGYPVANRRLAEIEGLIGFFVNTLVLRTRLEDEQTFLSVLEQVRESMLAADSHQDLPFERLVEELHPDRSLSHSPLFQVMITLNNTEDVALRLPGLEVEPIAIEGRTAKFDLTFAWEQQDQRLAGCIEFSSDLFERATIERMARHYCTILDAVVLDPELQIEQIPLLDASERQQLLESWRSAQPPYPLGPCIHQVFEEQAHKSPDAVALLLDDQQMSYGELNSKANQLAHYLRDLGVGPDTLVGVCLERSLDMIVGLLGILKAGGAYVPLDPEHPPERLAYMLADARAPVVVTQADLKDRLPASGAYLVCLDADREGIARHVCTDPIVDTSPLHLAYCIYTSGSTGQPKGVLIPHHNVIRLFESTRSKFHFDQTDVWSLFHSYAFDFSVWEMWGALFHGARLVIVPHHVARAPEAFRALLIHRKVTVLNQTPSVFHHLVQLEQRDPRPSDFAPRLVIFGGEALPQATIQAWFNLRADTNPTLVNMYGITETTVHVTYLKLSAATPAPASIGKPIPDLTTYVLDANLQPVPLGVPGEIHVAGAGLARGYLHRPDLTAERFVPNPYGPPGSRMYRSGDWGRCREDGSIEFLGRADHQVKIRGFRIELGEIHAALLRYPMVREAFVMVREDVPGEKRLVAYLVPQPQATLTVAHVREHLAQILPQYMIPAAYVLLQELPINQNGKIDRQALPSPPTTRSPDQGVDYIAPRTQTEQTLANIWANILKLDKVGIHDNFFALGGHSLQAMFMASQVTNEIGISVSLVDCLQAGSLRDLAARLDHQRRQNTLV